MSETVNASQGKEHWLPCSKCGNDTCHKVLQSVETSKTYEPDGIWVAEQYEIVQCQGCKTISFRADSQCSENTSHDDDGNEYLDHKVEIYPGRIAGRHKLRDYYFLPANIQNIYEETHAALCNRIRVLASVGIRALIEVVCKDQNATGDNLEKRIDSLVVLGTLTKDGAEILHSLRIMGNEAAHEVKPPKDEELDVAFDVVEHVLQGVYLLKLRAESLPKRKKTP
jgi:hypothetical protein